MADKEGAEDAERDANERSERDYWDCRRRGNRDTQGVCPPPSFSASSALSVGGRKKGRTTMVVRVGSMYGGAWDFNDYIRCVYEKYCANLTNATEALDVSRNAKKKYF